MTNEEFEKDQQNVNTVNYERVAKKLEKQVNICADESERRHRLRFNSTIDEDGFKRVVDSVDGGIDGAILPQDKVIYLLNVFYNSSKEDTELIKTLRKRVNELKKENRLYLEKIYRLEREIEDSDPRFLKDKIN